ncbi:TetR/AcrR family transcriptional regulator [Neobacillus sp. SM06]|uniref:TetR/AcrR family transcriptional regulator n=1 Tax=Neobacillus sp. SM06 TaxID=3422492 RepID=UPI003D2B32F3
MSISEMVEDLFKDEHLTEKQKRIIEAAVLIFSTKGFFDSSTKEIAINAGVAEGTIFRYYRTKKDLLQSIMEKTISKLTTIHGNGMNETERFDNRYKNLKDFISTFIKERYDMVKKYSPLVKILLHELTLRKEIWEPYFLVNLRSLNEDFKNLFGKLGQKDDRIKNGSETALRLIITTMVGFFVFKFLLDQEINGRDEDEIEMIVNYIVDGLVVRA